MFFRKGFHEHGFIDMLCCSAEEALQERWCCMILHSTCGGGSDDVFESV